MATVADWRKETDPRKVVVLETLHRLMTEGMGSPGASRIVMEPLPCWQNGLGVFEMTRMPKIDLTKLAKTG
jgi:hypothetical protein